MNTFVLSSVILFIASSCIFRWKIKSNGFNIALIVFVGSLISVMTVNGIMKKNLESVEYVVRSKPMDLMSYYQPEYIFKSDSFIIDSISKDTVVLKDTIPVDTIFHKKFYYFKIKDQMFSFSKNSSEKSIHIDRLSLESSKDSIGIYYITKEKYVSNNNWIIDAAYPRFNRKIHVRLPQSYYNKLPNSIRSRNQSKIAMDHEKNNIN